jgi:DNA-binding MarR family transcriptional regulator
VGERVLRAMAHAAPTGPRPGFDLDNHVFYLFTQILGRRNRDLALDLEPLGVSVPQWRILAVLHERAGCTMNELADVTTVDRTTLTRTLDRMARDRLIGRRSDARDRRSVRLSLTAAGKDAFRRVLPLVVAQNERAMRGFGPSALAALRANLHRMMRNLDADYDQRNAAWLAGRAAVASENRRSKGDPS